MRDLTEWDAHLGRAHNADPKKCPFPNTAMLVRYLGQNANAASLLTVPKRNQFLELVGLPYDLGMMLHADPRLRGAVMDEILQQVGYERLPAIMETITQQMASMEEPLAGKTKVLELLFSQSGILRPKKQVFEVDSSVKVEISISPPNSLPIRPDEEVIEGVITPPPALEEPSSVLQNSATRRVAAEETALKSILDKR